MAIDMAKMKAKMAAAKGEDRKNRNDVFWRPQDGEQTIRILPTPDGDPFKEFWFHYNLGTNPGFLSPKKNFGEDCPLDSFIRELFNDGTDESVKMAKSLIQKNGRSNQITSPISIQDGLIWIFQDFEGSLPKTLTKYK